jgi:hypothetical protein
MLKTAAPREITFALAVVFMTGAARAQGAGDSDARRLAIGQAEQARDAHDHQRALDFAMRAGAINMTPSLREFIAEESAALGMFGEALRSAILCEREAMSNHTVNSRDAILSSCRSMITSLRPRVGYVILHADAAPAGLQLRVAGQPVNVILLDADYAVTPGDIAIEASGPGTHFATRVTVAVGAHQRIDVQLRPVENSSAPPPSRATSASSTPENNVASGGGSASSGILHPLSIAGVGVGAALVVGSIVTLSYFFGSVVAHCSTSGMCDTDQQAANATSLSLPLQAAGYGMLVGGVVIAALGVGGLVASGRSHADVPPSTHGRGVRVVPIIGSAMGLAVRAEF